VLILLGTGSRTYEFDHVEREHCAKCDCEREFVLRMKYEYGHFYHLFGWVMSREYQLICPACAHGWRIEPRNARALIGRDPVPFHQRAGWLVLVLLVVVVAVASVAYHRRNAAPVHAEPGQWVLDGGGVAGPTQEA
jgi:hypothetical protein